MGRVGVRQLQNDFDILFGVQEDDVEFMPDIADQVGLTLDGTATRCGGAAIIPSGGGQGSGLVL